MSGCQLGPQGLAYACLAWYLVWLQIYWIRGSHGNSEVECACPGHNRQWV